MKGSLIKLRVTATFLNFEDDSILPFIKDKVGPIPERASSEFTSLFTPPRRSYNPQNSDNMQRIIHSVKWKQVDRFPDYYISNTGVVRIGKTIITPDVCMTNGGYLYVPMRNKEQYVHMQIHTLVWNHFSGVPRKRGWDVHHKDENLYNNHIDNLEYLSHADHMKKHVELRKVKNKPGLSGALLIHAKNIG